MNNHIELLHTFANTVTDPAQKMLLKKAIIDLAESAKSTRGNNKEPAHQVMLRMVEEAGDDGLDARKLFVKFGWGSYKLNIEMRRLVQEQNDRSKFVWLRLDGTDREYEMLDEKGAYQHIVIAGRGDKVPVGWEDNVPSQEKNKSTGHWKMVSVEAAEMAAKVEAVTAEKTQPKEDVRTDREMMSLAELAEATRS